MFEPIVLPADSPVAVPLRERGVYLIAGGFGAIGGALAKHFATEAGAPRAARSIRAPAARAVGRVAGGARRTRRHAREDSGGRELEARGAEVLAAPPTLPTALRCPLRRLRHRRVRPHRRRHLRGGSRRRRHSGPPADSGPSVLAAVRDVRPGDADRQFRPKMRGLYVLEEVLGERPLDFCLIVSSLSCVLGGRATP